MKKYKKIGQYKDAIKGLILQHQFCGTDKEGRPQYDKERQLPTIPFKGTVKVHGTNAGLHCVVDKDDDITIQPQSRTQKLGGDSGHYGFVGWVNSNLDIINKLALDTSIQTGTSNFTVYGEWAGNGIQKKVGVCRFEKFFYVFSIFNHETGEWLEQHHVTTWDHEETRILNAYDLGGPTVFVNLNNPEDAISQLNKYTQIVENSCPVAHRLSLIDDKPKHVEHIGEGMVWVSENAWFKTKGEKHSCGGAKKATVCPIKAANMKEFTDKVVTKDRMKQAWDVVYMENKEEIQMKHLGQLMKWMYNDIINEEGDALEANNLEAKEVGRAISQAAKGWFIDQIRGF